MKTNVLLLVYALLAAATSLFMLINPSLHLFVFGGTGDPQSLLLVRYIGGLFGGIAVMAWMARNAMPSKALEAMLLGFAVSSGLAAVAAAMMAVSGLYHVVMWVWVATDAILCACFLLAWKSSTSTSAKGSGPMPVLGAAT